MVPKVGVDRTVRIHLLLVRIRKCAILGPFPYVAAQVEDVAIGPRGLPLRVCFDRTRVAAMAAHVPRRVALGCPARREVCQLVFAGGVFVAPRVAVLALPRSPFEL